MTQLNINEHDLIEMIATFWAEQAAPLCKGGTVKTIMSGMIKKYEQSLIEMPAHIFHLGE